MKDDGQARLPEGADGAGLAEDARPGGNHEVLLVGCVDGDAHQTIHGSGKRAIEPVGEDGVDEAAFEEWVSRADVGGD